MSYTYQDLMKMTTPELRTFAKNARKFLATDPEEVRRLVKDARRFIKVGSTPKERRHELGWINGAYLAA